MPIAFDRSICCDLNETISREWLITNGLAGYAAGTIAGVLTRMQHGLLVSSPLNSATPQLLLAKMDEEILFDQRTYYLGTNEYRDGTLNPSGFVHLETFHLEEGFPIFTYRLGGIDGIMLEKRIWMPHGQNTTYIQYRVLRTTADNGPAYVGNGRKNTTTPNNGYERYYRFSEAAQRELTLTLLPFAAYRPHHQPQYGNNDWYFQVQSLASEDEPSQPVPLPKGVAGCTIRAWDRAHPYHIVAIGHPESQTTFIPTNVWYWHFLRRHDQAAGRPPEDDLYLPGVIRAKLWPGEDCTLTILVTAEELASQTLNPTSIDLSYKCSVERQRNLLQVQRYFGEGGETARTLQVLPLSTAPDLHLDGKEYLRLLLQAGDRFLISNKLLQNETIGEQSLFNEQARTPVVLSDYYTMDESTRDTLIALPGLTLVTGRYEEARRILSRFARSFKQGLLPDHPPLSGLPLEECDYGNVDTTLWYFYALDYYLRTTRDYAFLDEVYQRLVDSMNWYIRGTYNGIQVDTDGLLAAQEAGKATTWMNATINGVPVTPRQGKAVEVNALWYHALSLMHEWSQIQHSKDRTSYNPSFYKERSAQCKQSFHQRFWHADGNYLYDLVDAPQGNDAAIRPNQLFAVSLRYPVLDPQYRPAVFESVTQHLLTPYGLRTLAPQEAEYQGRLRQSQEDQLRVLHQGSAWPWLIGPYIDAMFSIENTNSTTNNTPDENLRQEYLWRKSFQLLEPFRTQFNEGILGMLGSVFDGDLPQQAAYTATSALSIGEILRVCQIPIDTQRGSSRLVGSVHKSG